MLRVPKQCASVDLYENLFRTQEHCEGVTYRGEGDLATLIHNPIHGPSFCSTDGGIRVGAFYAGLGF